MPRLKGKASNNSLSLVLLTGLILVAVAVPLDYFNVINFAKFGTNANESPSVGGVSQPPAIATDTIDKVENIDK